MLQPFSGLSFELIKRPFQPKVRPGMWYVEARRENRTDFDYTTVTLSQAQADQINQSSDSKPIWLDIIISQTNGGGWKSIKKNFQSVTVLQWTEIDPANRTQILAAASDGASIREIFRLNLALKAVEL